jgi:hypothetical protein
MKVWGTSYADLYETFCNLMKKKKKDMKEQYLDQDLFLCVSVCVWNWGQVTIFTSKILKDYEVNYIHSKWGKL